MPFFRIKVVSLIIIVPQIYKEVSAMRFVILCNIKLINIILSSANENNKHKIIQTNNLKKTYQIIIVIYNNILYKE